MACMASCSFALAKGWIGARRLISDSGYAAISPGRMSCNDGKQSKRRSEFGHGISQGKELRAKQGAVK